MGWVLEVISWKTHIFERGEITSFVSKKLPLWFPRNHLYRFQEITSIVSTISSNVVYDTTSCTLQVIKQSPLSFPQFPESFPRNLLYRFHGIPCIVLTSKESPLSFPQFPQAFPKNLLYRFYYLLHRWVMSHIDESCHTSMSHVTLYRLYYLLHRFQGIYSIIFKASPLWSLSQSPVSLYDFHTTTHNLLHRPLSSSPLSLSRISHVDESCHM